MVNDGNKDVEVLTPPCIPTLENTADSSALSSASVTYDRGAEYLLSTASLQQKPLLPHRAAENVLYKILLFFHMFIQEGR